MSLKTEYIKVLTTGGDFRGLTKGLMESNFYEDFLTDFKVPRSISFNNLQLILANFLMIIRDWLDVKLEMVFLQQKINNEYKTIMLL